MKLLILVKHRLDYHGNPYGLDVCASLAVDALHHRPDGVTCEAAWDGNDIDRRVVAHGPDVVMLEALWVTPAKMRELVKLHPQVRWIIRIHSMLPFLAIEGNALGWLRHCAKIPNVSIFANHVGAVQELSWAIDAPVGYLPNLYYKPAYCPTPAPHRNGPLHLGSFGALRPFKNTINQAVAAKALADQYGRELHFHVNTHETDAKSNPILHNLHGLFAHSAHLLVEHPWQKHPDFLHTVAGMDLVLQVSFTETFNIVSADAVHVGVPVVVSPQVGWLREQVHADPNSVYDIKERISTVLDAHGTTAHNRRNLHTYHKAAERAWDEFFDTF